jgi:hypothetical protein
MKAVNQNSISNSPKLKSQELGMFVEVHLFNIKRVNKTQAKYFQFSL